MATTKKPNPAPAPATTAIVTVDPAEKEKFDRKISSLVKRVEDFQITSQADYERAWTGVENIDEALDNDPFIIRQREAVKLANASHKNAVTQLKAMEQPLLNAKQLFLKKRGDWSAKVVMENERKRQIELEAAKKKQLEDAKRESKKLEKQGHTEVAAEVMQRAVTTAPAAPPPAAAPAQAQGEVETEFWCFRIIDEAAIPNIYRVVDQSLIRKDVTGFCGKREIPGVYQWPEKRRHTR